MTILIDTASKRYTAKTVNLNFNVNVASTLLQLTLTHPAWPSGPCLNLTVVWDTGQSGTFTCGGGPLIDKQGNPLVGNIETTWQLEKPPGKASASVTAEIMQTINTAILVEAF